MEPVVRRLLGRGGESEGNQQEQGYDFHGGFSWNSGKATPEPPSCNSNVGMPDPPGDSGWILELPPWFRLALRHQKVSPPAGWKAGVTVAAAFQPRVVSLSKLCATPQPACGHLLPGAKKESGWQWLRIRLAR